MRRGWNQADIAVRLTTAGVVFLDNQQTGVFALRTGIRLQAHRRVAGTRNQHLLQFGNHAAIACGLRIGRERVDIGKFRPSDRQHFRSRVQLHGA